jgi:hypothetical protein
MADPFLLSHSCAPLLFTLAAPLTPVSIRDQMIRAKMFVDRAVEQALISANRPLLVMGAGAAGVTAAMRAAALRIPTTLAEASPQAFGRQKICATRWVDPTQYDWPADHWGYGFYPWMPPAMPLPWAAQLSSTIAAIWEREFQRALVRYSHLKFLPQTTVSSITVSPVTKDLSVVMSAQPGAATYGAAVSCIGFGIERASAARECERDEAWPYHADSMRKCSFGKELGPPFGRPNRQPNGSLCQSAETADVDHVAPPLT